MALLTFTQYPCESINLKISDDAENHFQRHLGLLYGLALSANYVRLHFMVVKLQFMVDPTKMKFIYAPINICEQRDIDESISIAVTA